MDGTYQNNIDALPELELYRYENIFKVHQKGDKNFYFYNILKTLQLPDDLNEQVFDYIKFPETLPLTTLSFKIYGTTHLWWLILIVNKIRNPFEIEGGKTLKYIKKPFLKIVLESIKDQLQ